jgi:hypothetical protein
MSLNITAALRARFWKQLFGLDPVPAPQYQATDNNYQEYGFNATNTGVLPTRKALNASNQYELNSGHVLIDTCLTLNETLAPANPTIGQAGTVGTTHYTYKVVGRAGNLMAPTSTVQTTTGNATLTAGNYNTVTFTAVPGFTVYDIYRTASSGTPSTTGLIGSVNAAFTQNTTPILVFNDTGITADGSTAPTTNTTGSVSGDWDVYGNVNVYALSTPAAPLAVVNGTAGSTTIDYEIVAYSGSLNGATGHTAASSATAVTTANATLTAANSITLTWQPVPGAVLYGVYRTSTNGTAPTTTGLIATVTGHAYTDTGAAGDSTSAPTTNTTGLIAGIIPEGSDFTYTDSITAHAGGTQAGAVALTTTMNRVSVVASTADSVALPLAAGGGFCIVINDATNALQLFGAGTDTINDVATATGIPIPGKSMVVCSTATSAPAGKWYTTPPIAVVGGKSLTVNNILTLAGTDATTMTFPTTSATVARTDAGQTFTGVQVFASPTITGNTVNSASLDPQTIQFASSSPSVAAFINQNSVPLTLVAAQGAGTWIEPVSLVISLGYGSAAFSSGGAVGVYMGSAAGVVVTNTIAASVFTTFAANKIASTTPLALGSTATASGILNTAAVLTNTSANFTGGTGAVIKIDFAYRVHNTFV